MFSQGDSIKLLKIIPILYTLFQSIKNKGILSDFIYDIKSDKHNTRMKITGQISLNNSGAKKILANKTQHYSKKMYYDQVGFIPGLWAILRNVLVLCTRLIK